MKRRRNERFGAGHAPAIGRPMRHISYPTRNAYDPYNAWGDGWQAVRLPTADQQVRGPSMPCVLDGGFE